VFVPAGFNQNMVNRGSVPLKLSTPTASPNHRDGVVHPIRTDLDHEYFDGKKTES